MNTRLKVSLNRFAALLSLSLAACAGADEDTSEPQVPEVQEEAKLVASLQTESGTRVDFYDFKTDSLIVETGPVGATPMLGPLPGNQNQLQDVWSSLAPTRPLPQGLKSLQERLNKQPRGPRLAEEITIRAEDVGFDDVVESRSTNKAACNNGCCNSSWLTSNFWECRGEDFLATRFSSPGSSIRPPRPVWHFGSLVCPGRGTGRWLLTWQNINLSMDVQEAQFAHIGRGSLGTYWLTSEIRGVGSSAIQSHCVSASF